MKSLFADDNSGEDEGCDDPGSGKEISDQMADIFTWENSSLNIKTGKASD